MLVTAQVALSLLLVVGAGLFSVGAANLINAGGARNGVVAVRCAPADPLVTVAAPLVLGAIALLACPAQGAASVDPMGVLRQE